jgi:hypothetical protein
MSLSASARHSVTLDELDGRLFADVPLAAAILGRDERTVRKAAAAGEIPAVKVGAKWMIRTAWLREQAGVTAAVPPAAVPDLDELADRIVDRLFARLAGAILGGAQVPEQANGPAVIRAEGADRYGGPHAHDNPAA